MICVIEFVSLICVILMKCSSSVSFFANDEDMPICCVSESSDLSGDVSTLLQIFSSFSCMVYCFLAFSHCCPVWKAISGSSEFMILFVGTVVIYHMNMHIDSVEST